MNWGASFPDLPQAWKLERMLRQILRKSDVLKATGGETPSDKYANAVDHLAERLMRREREPSAREAAFDIWGTLRDVYGVPATYDESLFISLGEQVVKGWSTCFVMISGSGGLR